MSDNASPVEVIVRWVAKPGCEKALHDVLRGMLAPTHAEPGQKLYDLYQSDDSRQFWFVESWPTAASFEVHKQSPHLKELGPKTAALIEGPAEVTMVKQVKA